MKYWANTVKEETNDFNLDWKSSFSLVVGVSLTGIILSIIFLLKSTNVVASTPKAAPPICAPIATWVDWSGNIFDSNEYDLTT